MKIHRSEDISILLLTELAGVYPSGRLSLADVAQKHGVSVLFLKKLARQLKHTGFIESKEGSGGGYRLKIAPDRIFIWDIIKALEKDPDERHQTQPDLAVCPIKTDCLPQIIKNKISGVLKSGLSRVSLSQFISI